MKHSTHLTGKTTSALLFFFVSTACLTVVAQNAIWNVNTTKGLSNDNVNSIVKDSKGFVWLGTHNGLNRFDGDQFQIFRHESANPNSLTDDKIMGLHTDRKNTLWIATARGACKYKYVTKKMTRIEYALQQGKPDPSNTPVLNFVENKGGDVFLTVMEQGVFICKNGGDKASPIPIKDQSKIISSYYVYDLTIDSLERVWFFADRIGLCRIDPGAEAAVLVSNVFYYTWFLKTAPDGNIWFGGDIGLYVYDVKNNRFQQKSDIRFISDICFAKDNTVWMVVENKGVYSGRPESNSFTLHSEFDRFPEFSRSIVTIFIDEQNLIWLGTKTDGVVVVDRRDYRFVRFVNHFLYGGDSKRSKFVTALEEDKAGDVWIGTYGGGVRRWNRTRNTFKGWSKDSSGASVPGDIVQDILRDNKGQIWVATLDGGICRYNPSTDTFRKFPCYNARDRRNDDMILSLYEDSAGNIWAGIQDGSVSMLKKGDGSFRKFHLWVTNVRCFFEDNDKTFWFGTDHFLVHFNMNTRIRTIYRIGAESNAVYRDTNGQLWVGTSNGLLLLDHKQKRLVRYTKSDGLCDNQIVGLVPGPDNYIWVSTMNGISRLDPLKKKFRTLSGYGGMPFTKFSRNAALRLQSGELSFGGNEGFYLVDPSKVSLQQKQLLSRLTQVLVGGTPIEAVPDFIRSEGPDGILNITVPYDLADLDIDFVAPEFESPGQVRYSYLLKGFDNHWSTYSNVKSARYSNLPDGTYFFRVRTGFSSGTWQKEEQLIKITVLPPWYRTWWAYLAGTLLLSVVLFFIVRFFWLRTLLRYEQALYHAKLDFFTNIAHEVRSHITLILGPVEMMLSGKSEEHKALSRLTLVKSNGERLLRLVNELLDFRKAEISTLFLQLREHELVSFLKAIFDSFSDLSEANRISAEFTTNADPVFVPFDPEQLEKVIFNLLVNAYKFTPEGGKIELNVISEEQFVSIEVKDSGQGIAPEHLKNLFVNFFQVNELGKKNSGFGIGLALSKKIVDQHGGTLTVKSIQATDGKPGGTVFTVRLRTTTP